MANANSTPIVSIRNAEKHYPLGRTVVHALRGVSLEVGTGEFLSIAGPSGSGKTTLLNLIGCVDTPSAGVVMVAGRDTGRLKDKESTRLRLDAIGFIFQSFNLVNALDVRQNVELPLLLQGFASRKERQRRALDLLEKVGLVSHARHRPNELSGGQRQRVAIARALITRPKLVLADEPTANLDSRTGATIIELMKELNRVESTTFVFSTHDAKVLEQASRRLYLADGRIERVDEATVQPASGDQAYAVGVV